MSREQACGVGLEHRAIALVALVATVAVLAACGGEGDDEERSRDAPLALTSESDSTFCGRSEDVFVNGTAFAKELHIRVRNGCHGRDTLGTDSMRVWVRSSTGQVVNGQDYRVPFGGTHRGAVSVTPGAMLRVECPRPLLDNQRHGCSWEYRYLLR